MANIIINMRRQQLGNLTDCNHAGLLLDRGFKIWAKDAVKQNGQIVVEQHNNEAHKLHEKAAKITASSLYQQAYKNWEQIHMAQPDNSKVWIGELPGRMYLGMGEASPLEAGITLHHTYGVPYIPGSAIKGVVSHYAHEIGLEENIREILFGKEASRTNKQDSGASGYIIFNDAWWVPKGKALAPEMITVHATKYYANKGNDAPHPDFESPNPNPQIAVQGSFLFSVEGDNNWAEKAIQLLARTMENRGVGAKSASGYGYFNVNNAALRNFEDEKNKLAQDEEQQQKQETRQKELAVMSPLERGIEKVKDDRPADLKPHLALLKALERGHWKDTSDQQQVASEIRELMKEQKHWKESSNKRNTSRDKDYQNTLKVLRYLK
jgi:CRISPR-associated protein Cmr6